MRWFWQPIPDEDLPTYMGAFSPVPYDDHHFYERNAKSSTALHRICGKLGNTAPRKASTE